MKTFPCFLFFGLFASESRLKILLALWDRPLAVQEICKKSGLEQSNVSHQLRPLLRCRVVKAERDGRKRIYSIMPGIKPIIRAAKRHTKKHCRKKCADYLERAQ